MSTNILGHYFSIDTLIKVFIKTPFKINNLLFSIVLIIKQVQIEIEISIM